jgi:hypothetical protein
MDEGDSILVVYDSTKEPFEKFVSRVTSIKRSDINVMLNHLNDNIFIVNDTEHYFILIDYKDDQHISFLYRYVNLVDAHTNVNLAFDISFYSPLLEKSNMEMLFDTIRHSLRPAMSPRFLSVIKYLQIINNGTSTYYDLNTLDEIEQEETDIYEMMFVDLHKTTQKKDNVQFSMYFSTFRSVDILKLIIKNIIRPKDVRQVKYIKFYVICGRRAEHTNIIIDLPMTVWLNAVNIWTKREKTYFKSMKPRNVERGNMLISGFIHHNAGYEYASLLMTKGGRPFTRDEYSEPYGLNEYMLARIHDNNWAIGSIYSKEGSKIIYNITPTVFDTDKLVEYTEGAIEAFNQSFNHLTKIASRTQKMLLKYQYNIMIKPPPKIPYYIWEPTSIGKYSPYYRRISDMFLDVFFGIYLTGHERFYKTESGKVTKDKYSPDQQEEVIIKRRSEITPLDTGYNIVVATENDYINYYVKTMTEYLVFYGPFSVKKRLYDKINAYTGNKQTNIFDFLDKFASSIVFGMKRF